MSSKEKKRTLYSSATIAAAAFNLPVMVIAGVIVGYLISINQEAPLQELIIIGTPILFFIIAIIELYYAVNRQQFQHISSKSSYPGLAKLIAEEKKDDENLNQQ
ncbi:MAG: hypothetical protein ACFFAE_14890 [Candidatus Hodarchaeota archaeon]